MASVTVTIRTGNAAFRDDEGALERAEVLRVLNSAATQLVMGHDRAKLFDVNGNVVGDLVVTEDPS